MKTYNKKILKNTLDQLGVKSGDNILLHCSLFSFGQLSEGESIFIEDLLDILGPKSSIFVPTFTLWLDQEEVFTLNTPSQRMGLVAEAIRLLPQSIRSVCPMHNHAAIGPLAELLKKPTGNYSTGQFSDFEIFYQQDFKNVFLGCSPTDSGTYLIHIEAIANVPYREWVKLKRKVSYSNNVVLEKEIHYFGRKKVYSNSTQNDAVGVSVDLSVLQEFLESKKILTKVKLPYGAAYCCSIREMHDELVTLLKAHPEFALR